MDQEHTPGWFPDPTAGHELRYWDGQTWTADVADRGIVTRDPLDVTGDSPLASPAPYRVAPPTARRGLQISGTAALLIGSVFALLLAAGAFAAGYAARGSGSEQRAATTVPTSCSAAEILGVARDWSEANDRYYQTLPDSAEEEDAYSELDAQEKRLGRTVARCS